MFGCFHFSFGALGLFATVLAEILLGSLCVFSGGTLGLWSAHRRALELVVVLAAWTLELRLATEQV